MSSSELTPDSSSWIGRHITADSGLDAEHAKRVALTLNDPIPQVGDSLPSLWQWAFFTDSVPTPGLGTDGHPATGTFLPPTGDRIRMWAGGRVNLSKPLLVGVPASKKSTIQAIQEKEGRQGKLLFVTIRHDYTQNGETAISEEQDLVYRRPSPPVLKGTQPAPQSQWTTQVEPHSTLLFRYSAVTFNSHRIHYDFPYVTAEEGYPALVVHGPLIATLMLRGFQNANPDKTVRHFAYRGLRPLVAPTPFHVAGRILPDGKAELWAEQDGTLAHQATVTLA